MISEEERYATINQQMADIQQQAIANMNPVKSLLSAMLLAEMYDKNERTHMRVMQVREDFVQALWARVRTLSE